MFFSLARKDTFGLQDHAFFKLYFPKFDEPLLERNQPVILTRLVEHLFIDEEYDEVKRYINTLELESSEPLLESIQRLNFDPLPKIPKNIWRRAHKISNLQFSDEYFPNIADLNVRYFRKVCIDGKVYSADDNLIIDCGASGEDCAFWVVRAKLFYVVQNNIAFHDEELHISNTTVDNMNDYMGVQSLLLHWTNTTILSMSATEPVDPRELILTSQVGL